MWSRERSLVVLIVFTILSSSVILALPAPVSAGTVISTPSDTTISVQQGQVFLVRNTLQFSTGSPGYFALAIYWYTNERWDNYTLENAPSAYWTSVSAGNPDSVGDPVENVVFDNAAITDGWQVSAVIDSSTKNYYNGTFNIDFWLRAASWGAPHMVGLENNLSYGVGIAIFEPSPNIIPEDNIAVNVTAWNRGVIAKGISPNTYDRDANPPPAFFAAPLANVATYAQGSEPPIVAATKVGSGKVIAGNIGATSRNNRWDNGTNPDIGLDQLLDSIFQWGKPGAVNVAWSEASVYGVYSQQKAPNNLTQSLTNKWGYVITGDNRTIENIADNFNWKGYDNITPIDVLVIPQYELGPASQGGDPTLLSDGIVTRINSWVNSGGVLLIMETADYSANNSYHRVNNKILKGVGSNWIFNNDTLVDNVDNYLGNNFQFRVAVDNTTGPGGAYTWSGNYHSPLAVGMYSPGSLILASSLSLGVGVSVTPNDNTAENGLPVTFNVTVTNNDNTWDNFKLTLTEDNAWGATINPASTGFIAPSTTGSAVVTVTIPGGASSGSVDHINVKATSFWDNSISDNKTVTAGVIVRGVSVSISPSYENGPNEATLTYIITAANTGNISDNYNLTVGDNAGWSPNVLPTSLLVLPGENGTATLSVTVPDNAINFSEDNIIITANGTGVSAENNCIAQVTTFRGVSVSISPSSKSGADGTTLTYIVTVNNTGNVSDNYSLAVSNIALPSWAPVVSPTSLTVSGGSSGNATLSVIVPSNAIGGTIDNMTVTATSQTDNTVSASASCTAHATAQVTIIMGVSVSISPSARSGSPGTKLSYTVTVTNTGGATDTIDLSVHGGTGWSPKLSANSLTLVAGNSGEATLEVTVPIWAATGLSTTITVTANSMTDLNVSASTRFRTTVSAPTPGPVTTTPTGASWIVIFVMAGAILAIILLLIIILYFKK